MFDPLRSPLRSAIRSPLSSSSITPSITLHTSPHTPRADRSPALGLGGPAQLRPQGKGKREVRNRARHRHECVDIQRRAIRIIRDGCQPGLAAGVIHAFAGNGAISVARTQGLTSELPTSLDADHGARCCIDTGRSARQCASNLLIEPRISALSDRSPHTMHPPGKHMGFVRRGFTRALSHDLQHSWKERRASQAQAKRLITRWFHGLPDPLRGVWWGVGPPIPSSGR